MLNLYCCVDKYTGIIPKSLVMSKNDIAYIRYAVGIIAPVVPFKDVQPKCIGQIDEETGCLMSAEQHDINWSIYSMPIDVEDSLSALGENAVERYREAVSASKKRSEESIQNALTAMKENENA